MVNNSTTQGMAERQIDGLSPRQLVWAMAVGQAVLVLIFIGGNIIHLGYNHPGEPFHPVFSHPGWNGDYDGSHAEILGHIQMALAAVFLLFAGAIRRIGVYAAWGVVMAAIVIDDMLQLHERVGEVLVREFDLPAIGGLRPQDSGELAVWGGLAGVLGIGLLIAHIRAPRPARRDSWLFIGAAAILVAFGVVLDQLLILIPEGSSVSVIQTGILLETTGEVSAMGLLLVLAFWIIVRRRPVAPVPASTAEVQERPDGEREDRERGEGELQQHPESQGLQRLH